MTPLPRWLAPLPDAERMRAADAWAIDRRGIPSLDLMERAGAGLAALVAEAVPAGRVAVVCGRGNNGGDGLVAARLLREQGRPADVLLVAEPDELSPDARACLERLPGSAAERFVPRLLDGAGVVIDALLGTGATGAPRGPVAAAIAAINACDAPVVAADVPSGVDASTGEVAGEAVTAVATAAFHAAKPGHFIAPGKACAGEVRVIDIGIPPGAPGEADVGLIERSVLALLPARAADATKFTAGSVVVIGGSTGLTGAPTLAAMGAARAGAGYVTVLVPASLNVVFEAKLTEQMTVPLPDAGGSLVPAALAETTERAGGAGAIVLGPGLGRAEEALAFARQAAAAVGRPLVVDADGLNAHAGALDALAGRSAPTVLTPHAGELGRLLGVTSAEVASRRLAAAREAAARSGAVVVLKGDDTIVAGPAAVGVSRGEAPALATAGTGDVLSGVIGAFLAAGLDAFAASCAAVELHRLAGRAAAEARGTPDGVIAGDVAEMLPAARTGARPHG